MNDELFNCNTIITKTQAIQYAIHIVQLVYKVDTGRIALTSYRRPVTHYIRRMEWTPAGTE